VAVTVVHNYSEYLDQQSRCRLCIMKWELNMVLKKNILGMTAPLQLIFNWNKFSNCKIYFPDGRYIDCLSLTYATSKTIRDIIYIYIYIYLLHGA
jgi:hypothetical protein